jgi:hypothetical protein
VVPQAKVLVWLNTPQQPQPIAAQSPIPIDPAMQIPHSPGPRAPSGTGNHAQPKPGWPSRLIAPFPKPKKRGSKGSRFVIFGEADIAILISTGPAGQPDQIQVKINDVDVGDLSSGHIAVKVINPWGMR